MPLKGKGLTTREMADLNIDVIKRVSKQDFLFLQSRFLRMRVRVQG